MVRTVLLVLLYVLFSAIGNLLLAYGMKQKPLSVPHVGWGTVIMTLSYGVYLVLLRNMPLSVAVPAGAATYLIIAAISRWILNEQVPWMRWLGAAVVTAGVAIVMFSDSPLRRSAPPAAGRPGERRGTRPAGIAERLRLPVAPSHWLVWLGQPSS